MTSPRVITLCLGALTMLLAGEGCRCDAGTGPGLPQLTYFESLLPLPTATPRPLPFTTDVSPTRLAPEVIKVKVGGIKGTLSTLDLDEDLRWAIRGALLKQGSPRLIVHVAKSAAPLGRDWFLVHATSGLWLHETTSFVKRARLAPPPIAGVAASPDGKMFAYAVGKDEKSRMELVVVSFPDLEVKTRVAGLDPIRRMRFSADGRRVMLSSAAGGAVTLVDVEGGGTQRSESGDEMKEVALPGAASSALAGKVEEVASTTKGISVAATDQLALAAFDDKGAMIRMIGPFGRPGEQRPARAEAFPDGTVVAVLDGRLVRWDPAEDLATVCPDYQRTDRWTLSTYDGDTVAFACRGGVVGLVNCPVHRVAHAEIGPDVEGAGLGAAEFEATPVWLDFAESERALIGIGPNRRIRLAFVHSDGKLEARLDTPAISEGRLTIRGDRKAYGYLDPSGRLYEFKAKPPSSKEIGQIPEAAQVAELSWYAREKRWRVGAADGSEITVAPLP